MIFFSAVKNGERFLTSDNGPEHKFHIFIKALENYGYSDLKVL